MKRPLLKILPGVTVVLITPSCNKDNDNIAEDNAVLVAEQVINNQVFYLKINNASSLSKMTVAGLDKGGQQALKFEKGDVLTIKFDVNAFFDYSDGDFIWVEKVTVSATAECINEEDGVFEITPGDFTRTGEDSYDNISWTEAANDALKEMQDGVPGAASKYNVQLSWGVKDILTSNDFKTKGFVEFQNMTTMLADAPRSANKSFTLEQDGDYCFIVFEKGCSKKVMIGGKTLDNSKCYIVASGINVSVDDVPTTTQSGDLYYVRKNTENVEE